MYATDRLLSQADFSVNSQPVLPITRTQKCKGVRYYTLLRVLFAVCVIVHAISIFLMLYVMLNIDPENDIYSKMTLICYTLWIVLFILDYFYIIYRSFGNRSNECIGHNYISFCSESHIYYNNDLYCCACGLIYYPYKLKNVLFRFLSYMKPSHVIANFVGYGLYLGNYSSSSINTFYGPFVLCSLLACSIIITIYAVYKMFIYCFD
jgi:hypothetical protein